MKQCSSQDAQQVKQEQFSHKKKIAALNKLSNPMSKSWQAGSPQDGQQELEIEVTFAKDINEGKNTAEGDG